MTSHAPLRRQPLLALAAVLLLALALTSSARAATFGTQGIPSGPGVSRADTDRALDLARKSGAKLVRVPISWAALEPQAPGQRDPATIAALDLVIGDASQRGMKTVLVIGGTPCWASSAPAAVRGDCTGAAVTSSEVERYQPSDPASVVGAATFLAARYARNLGAFQVWNEPDQANELYWAGPNKVATYSAMVKAVYGPLKQAAPQVPVLVGSFVGINGAWLKGMYAEGIKGYYDGLAVQFYARTLYALRTTRAVQQAAGDTRPLWLTEWGYAACAPKGQAPAPADQPCVSPSVARQSTEDVLTGLRTKPWVKAAIQYSLYDTPGSYRFGLVDAAGKLKSTWAAVRRVLTGKVRKPRKPTVRFRVVGDHVRLTGTASYAELLTVQVTRGGRLAQQSTLLADKTRRWKLDLAPQVGTSGLVAKVSAGYAGKTTAKQRRR